MRVDSQKSLQGDAIALRDSIKEQETEEDVDDECRELADQLLISMIRRDRYIEMMTHL